MKKITSILIGLALTIMVMGQNSTVNAVVKNQDNVQYIRSGGFIFEINDEDVKYFSLGWLSDEIHEHNISEFLNFDIKDSLMLTLEYVNHKVDQPHNPNRFALQLKDPSIGNAVWKKDILRFSIDEYVQKNLNKFFYDVLIIDRYTYNFFFLQDGILKIYEIEMNNGFQGVKTFKCKNELKTEISTYFNVVLSSENDNKYLFSGGDYFEIKKRKLVKVGDYSKEDAVIRDSKKNAINILDKNMVETLVDEIKSYKVKDVKNGKYIIDRFVNQKELIPIRKVNF